jgi:hypothetical protein
VDLSGEWQIDLPLSDFPNEAVTPLDSASGAASTSGSGTGQGGGHGGRGGGRGRGMGASQSGNPLGNGQNRAGMPEHHFAMPPHLSIRQSATGIVVDVTMPDGKHVSNAYTAGDRKVVTTTRGAADQTLGWNGDAFVIRTKAGEKGPQSEVRYTLDRDGTLAVISTITNSGIYDFQYTLEYDHVTP